MEQIAYESEKRFLRQKMSDSNDQHEKDAILKRLGQIAEKLKRLRDGNVGD